MLFRSCYEFLNQLVGPYSFVLSDKPREITIKDEIKIVEPEDPRYRTKELFNYPPQLNRPTMKRQERKSWEDIFGINNKYRESNDKKESYQQDSSAYQLLEEREPDYMQSSVDTPPTLENLSDNIILPEIEPYIVILLTEHANYENWFVGYDPNQKGNYFIHTEGWDHFTSVDPRYPICYHIASTLLKHSMFDNPQEMGNYMHYQSKGCMMDFCRDKSEVMLKLRTADVCRDCQKLIFDKKIPHLQLRYTFDMMESIRRQLLYKDRYELLRQASPMHVKGRLQKIYLPEMGMLQVNLTPTERAVYLLFLMVTVQSTKEDCLQVAKLEKAM